MLLHYLGKLKDKICWKL